MPLVGVLGRQPPLCARSMLVGANNGAVEQQPLQVVILEGFVHTAQAISFPRLTFQAITKQ